MPDISESEYAENIQQIVKLQEENEKLIRGFGSDSYLQRINRVLNMIHFSDESKVIVCKSIIAEYEAKKLKEME